MRSVIAVHPDFDHIWPYAADRFKHLLAQDGDTELIRWPEHSQSRLGELVKHPETVVRLVSLQVPISEACLDAFTALEEVSINVSGYGFLPSDSELGHYLNRRGIKAYTQPTEGYWGPSVSEFALALTLCGLRRIPQKHREIIADQKPWDHTHPSGSGKPNSRGQQFSDDLRFTNGTIEGKRIRIVGAGNIASRYASFVNMMGADVAAWDPFASESSFHRAGSRKEWHLDRLVQDAEIFVPMVPLTPNTRGLITAEHIRMLPKGTLVVLATRAEICDMPELRRRVLEDELSLAADVFDIEPLPLDDPLLGCDHVVHTPHVAGRTKEANFLFAEKIYEQFVPR